MIVLYVLGEMIPRSRKQPGKNVLAAIAEIERLIDEAISGAAVRCPGSLRRGHEAAVRSFDVRFRAAGGTVRARREEDGDRILRGQTEERARALANRNPTRIDLSDRLSDLIDQYNAVSLDVERLFEELTAFTRSLDEEEQRHLKENLSEDELAVFDILTRPEPKLTKAEDSRSRKSPASYWTS